MSPDPRASCPLKELGAEVEILALRDLIWDLLDAGQTTNAVALYALSLVVTDVIYGAGADTDALVEVFAGRLRADLLGRTEVEGAADAEETPE